MEREMASTAPISHPSQYMIATTRQMTPAEGPKTLNYTRDLDTGSDLPLQEEFLSVTSK